MKCDGNKPPLGTVGESGLDCCSVGTLGGELGAASWQLEREPLEPRAAEGISDDDGAPSYPKEEP